MAMMNRKLSVFEPLWRNSLKSFKKINRKTMVFLSVTSVSVVICYLTYRHWKLLRAVYRKLRNEFMIKLVYNINRDDIRVYWDDAKQKNVDFEEEMLESNGSAEPLVKYDKLNEGDLKIVRESGRVLKQVVRGEMEKERSGRVNEVDSVVVVRAEERRGRKRSKSGGRSSNVKEINVNKYNYELEKWENEWREETGDKTVYNIVIKKKKEEKNLKEKLVEFDGSFENRIREYESNLIKEQSSNKGVIIELNKNKESSLEWKIKFEREMEDNEIEIKVKQKSDRLSKHIEKVRVSLSRAPSITQNKAPISPYNSSQHISRMKESISITSPPESPIVSPRGFVIPPPNPEQVVTISEPERNESRAPIKKEDSQKSILSKITSPVLSEESSDEFYSFSDEEVNSSIKSDDENE